MQSQKEIGCFLDITIFLIHIANVALVVSSMRVYVSICRVQIKKVVSSKMLDVSIRPSNLNVVVSYAAA